MSSKCASHLELERRVANMEKDINGNGTRGLKSRQDITETQLAIIKFIGGALFLTTLSTLAGVIMLYFRVPGK